MAYSARAMEPSIYELPKDTQSLEQALRSRQTLLDPEELGRVAALFEEVRRNGDSAIRAATERFDKVVLSSLRIDAAVADQAVANLTSELRESIETCRKRIEAVNEALMPPARTEHQLDAHTTFGETCTALDSVALWVPCRKGPLVSTALMLVVAAKVAGVPRIALCTPPVASGGADPVTLAAARLAGATEFYVGNGVALIAGLTLGTESLASIAGVFGPGPSGITLAMGLSGMYGKRTCLGLGPSDCLVLCDESADPRLIALDLMTEAEHGPDSSAVLVTTSRAIAERVQRELVARIAGAGTPPQGAAGHLRRGWSRAAHRGPRPRRVRRRRQYLCSGAHVHRVLRGKYAEGAGALTGFRRDPARPLHALRRRELRARHHRGAPDEWLCSLAVGPDQPRHAALLDARPPGRAGPSGSGPGHRHASALRGPTLPCSGVRGPGEERLSSVR